MNSQMKILKTIYKDSPVATVLTDENLTAIWCNEVAISHYPILAIPGGLLLLIPTDMANKIKESKEAVAVPLDIIKAFFTAHPVQDGFIVSVFFEKEIRGDSFIGGIVAPISAVSAPMKASLSGIFVGIGSVSQMADRLDNERLHEIAKEMNSEAYLLLRADRNIQTYLRYLDVPAAMVIKATDLTEIVSQIAKAVSLMMVTRDLEFESYIEEGSLVITTAPSVLLEGLIHILSNACKYSVPGNIVTLSLTSTKTNAIITITDKGPGIPMHLAQKVFEPFFSYTHDSEYSQGTGLGLSIAKLSINALGGSLALTSKEDGGTTVAVSLPLSACVDVMELSLPQNIKDMFRDRFSTLHVIMSDSCTAPTP